MRDEILQGVLNDFQPLANCKKCYGLGRILTDHDLEFNKRPYCKCITDQVDRLAKRMKSYQKKTYAKE